MSDATLVTGSSSSRALRRGDVLGERYEIVETLEQTALIGSYRATDQESDATVLVRCTAPGLIDERDARRIVERGKALVGGGGRLLSALREVDREAATVFSVERWPRGTSMRAVLDARRAKGTSFDAREILPMIARLAAALASIPDPYWHGDVRAERIWIDPDGLVLTGAFLVSLLPGDAVSEALRDDVGLRRRFAPEVGEGLGGRASDRWGAASIVWEALTGSSIEPGPVTLPDALGPAALEVARLLSPDPATRPPTLDALVAKIAELARMPVPRVELDPFPIKTIETTPDEPTHVAADLAPATERPPAFGDPPTERTPSFDSAETDLEEVGTDPTARDPSARASHKSDDTAPHAALGPDGTPARADDLDPRLVRAALADDHELDSRELEMLDEKSSPKIGAPQKAKNDDLDPRLVRAALGIVDEDSAPKADPRARPKRSAAVTQELEAQDLEPVRAPGAAAKAAVAKKPASIEPPKKAGAALGPPRKGATSSDLPKQAASSARVSAPPAGRKRPVQAPEPVALPQDIKPIPRPRVITKDSGEMKGPVLFDASRPSPPAPVAPAPAPIAPAAMAAPAPMAIAAPGPIAPVAPRPGPARPQPARSSAPAWASWAIVAGAIVLAIVIVAGGFWYRASLQREAEHQRMIQDRLRQLQQQ